MKAQNIRAIRTMSLSLTAAMSLSLAAGPVAAQEDDASSDAGDSIEEVVVLGRAQNFYRVSESAVGTKTPTDFLDIPISIQVLSNQLIEDLGARQITDLYRSMSGVSQYSYSGVTARGFRQDEIRYDGVAGDPFSEFGIPELFNIERVEVMKGPAGALYGASQPGAVINYVTKKPTEEELAKVMMQVGSYDLVGFAGEYSGPLNDSGTLRGRVGGFHQKEEPFRYNVKDENTITDIGLEYVPNDDTSLLLQATYLEQHITGGRIRGVPVDDNGNFLADIRWTASEPSDFQYLESTVLQGTLKHRLDVGAGLDTSLTLRHIDNERIQKYHEPRGATDLDGDGDVDSVIRQYRDQFRTNDEFSITLDNIYTSTLAGQEHTILFGLDYFEQDALEDLKAAQSDTGTGQVPSLSLSNPVYGLTSGTNYTDFPSMFFIHGNLARVGLYLQDQVNFSERWSLLAGLRFDSFDNEDLVGANSFRDENISFRGGLVYRARPNLSTYASYSGGFVPQNLGSQDPAFGGPFDPEESSQIEAGLKAELFGGRTQASISAYEIVKENVLQPDPDPNAPVGALIEFGEVTSQGVEIDFVGDITDRWVIAANYAYNDTRITATTGAYVLNSAGGDKFSNAPENQAGLWTRFELPNMSSAISGGVDYMDERLSFNGQHVPSYTVYDLSWHTYWKNLTFQLNVRNLFDEEYAQSGFTSRAGHFPGEPRTVTFRVSAAL